MSKKRGQTWDPRSVSPPKTPPKIEILLQIYQGITKEFQRDVTFQLYQDLLGYEVVEWRKSNVGGEEPTMTPTSGFGPSGSTKDSVTPLDLKKRSERKLSLRSGAACNGLEATT